MPNFSRQRRQLRAVAEGQLLEAGELPDLGRELTAGDPCAVVESVKTASDIYTPLSGEIIDTNDALDTAPSTVNNDPYGDGWFFKMTIGDKSQFDGLMDEAAYKSFCDGL